VKSLETNKGICFIVDDEDYDLIHDLYWCGIKTKHAHGSDRFYIKTLYKETNHARKHLSLARLLIGVFDKNIKVDHINGDTLDNRKSNLRKSTNFQNAQNRRKTSRHCNSKYKGVVKREGGKWQASIKFNRQYKFLGTFLKEEDAARAYNSAALKYHGEFSCINEIL
jgi:hypothetical protein